MKRLDFYVQHLVRQNADSLELRSGRPAKFGFKTGSRMSNQAIDHAQIAGLVTESAPRETIAELRQNQTASFNHTAAGVTVTVRIAVSGAQDWTVQVVPGGTAAPRAPAGTEPKEEAFERPVGGVMAGAAPTARTVGREAPAPVQSAAKAPAKVSAGRAGEPGINRYLRAMVDMGASDLHLSTGMPPLVRHDGEMKPLSSDSPFTVDQLRSLMMEIVPERSETEFEETSDADFAHTIEGVARFRANYFMDLKGPGAVFRQIPFEILTHKQLGIPEKVLDLCYLTKGLVVVTGPTGSGKSTTLAALIDYINEKRADHIITIEDPVEFVHPNKKCLVNQREVGTHTQSFKRALRAALREDPDIVLVGEMRDLETVAIAIETAETGHLVFGTLHTTSAKSTVDRIIDQFPADRQEQIRVMLSESLRGVIAQVLCKKEGGGRAAAFEIMIANNAVANLIREGKTFQLTSIMQTGKKLGMQTMNDHLMQLVTNGTVGAEEAYMKSNDKQAFRDALTRANITLNLGSN